MNFLKEMASAGLLKLYQYPSRPENIPLDNSDLIDKYIYFENTGITSAIDSLLSVYPEFKEMVIEKLDNSFITANKIDKNKSDKRIK